MNNTSYVSRTCCCSDVFVNPSSWMQTLILLSRMVNHWAGSAFTLFTTITLSRSSRRHPRIHQLRFWSSHHLLGFLICLGRSETTYTTSYSSLKSQSIPAEAGQESLTTSTCFEPTAPYITRQLRLCTAEIPSRYEGRLVGKLRSF